MKPATQCIHSGGRRDPQTRGINTPIYTSSVYEYLDWDKQPYPRYFNTPNHDATVEKICALEGAQSGLLFASGMAAIATSLLALLRPGDKALFQDETYGGTYHLMQQELPRHGITPVLVRSQAEDLIEAMADDIRLLYLESPTNPLLTVIDLEKVANAAKAGKILTVIDNTFASPINQNPLDLGIDLVVHSGTKYLGGHSDLCCGVVAGPQKLVDQIRQSALCYGGSLGARDCSLLERSLKTLSLRVERQSASAALLADFLHGHSQVARVYYPGLSSHPGHAVAKKQMRAFGAMLSFELKSGDPLTFQKALRLIQPALSLGGVESTITAPAVTSHRHLSTAERKAMGIGDGLLRLSVGIEDSGDLQDDLDFALTNC